MKTIREALRVLAYLSPIFVSALIIILFNLIIGE